MPAHCKSLQQLQDEVGPDFKVISAHPPVLACRVCRWDAVRRFSPKHLQRHIATQKHREANAEREKEHLSFTAASSTATTSTAAAVARDWEQLDDSFLFPDDEARLQAEQYHDIMQMEDDVEAWAREAADMKAAEDHDVEAMGRDRSDMLQALGGDAFPFKNREVKLSICSQPTGAGSSNAR
ncbi:unnamed protein product [Tilletia caries]|uniref:Uncharacterized protein n=2 Tax=Tilletia TaxID=13289 RepID=A0ABN7JBK2_9BASI|nr:unnamed protein product [Tilletia caries]CAD6961250.1 unnamed protein product [Tilletia caries]